MGSARIEPSMMMMVRMMRPWIGSCAETGERLSDHLEHGFAPRVERRVQRHLSWCRRCRALYESFARTVEKVRALGNDDERTPAPSIVTVVTERIRRESS